MSRHRNNYAGCLANIRIFISGGLQRTLWYTALRYITAYTSMLRGQLLSPHSAAALTHQLCWHHLSKGWQMSSSPAIQLTNPTFFPHSSLFDKCQTNESSRQTHGVFFFQRNKHLLWYWITARDVGRPRKLPDKWMWRLATRLSLTQYSFSKCLSQEPEDCRNTKLVWNKIGSLLNLQGMYRKPKALRLTLYLFK